MNRARALEAVSSRLARLQRFPILTALAYFIGLFLGYQVLAQCSAALVAAGQPWRLLQEWLIKRPEQALQAQLVAADPQPVSVCAGDSRFVAQDCPNLDGGTGLRIVLPAPHLNHYLSLLNLHAKAGAKTRYYLQAPPWLWSDAAVDAFAPRGQTFFLDAMNLPKAGLPHVSAVLRTVALAAGYPRVTRRPEAPVGPPSSLLNVSFTWPPQGNGAYTALLAIVTSLQLQDRVVWIARRSWLPADTSPDFRAAFERFATAPEPAFGLGVHRLLN